MLVALYKLAHELDKKGLHDESSEIEEVMRTMSQRVGLKVEDFVALANYFDEQNETELADKFDELAKEAKSKGDKKFPNGAKHKAPKNWFREQLEKVMKGNPKYSKEKATKTVADLWDNKLTDAKRQAIYKRYGKTKSPNK